MTFGQKLAARRRARGWSQEALAHRAGLSQRHISFLETGRSQPGSHSLSKLMRAMALKGWEHRELLASLSPDGFPDESRVHDNMFVSGLVERMTPWPAYAFEPDGSLVATNEAMRRLIRWASLTEDLWEITAPPNGPNIYDLVFHPRGLICWLANPELVLPETLRRLRVDASHHQSIETTLKRIEAFQSIKHYGVSDIPPPVLIEKYQIEGDILSITSVLSHLASAGELFLDLLRIESFVPADDASEALLMRV